jgi:hypothetical protein
MLVASSLRGMKSESARLILVKEYLRGGRRTCRSRIDGGSLKRLWKLSVNLLGSSINVILALVLVASRRIQCLQLPMKPGMEKGLIDQA